MTPRTDADPQPDTAAMPAVTDVVRGLHLPPEVERLAHWRNLSPLPAPELPAFDLSAALDRLTKVRRVDYHSSDWSEAKLRWGMSAEEARFWVVAAARWCKSHDTPQQLIAHLRKNPNGPPCPAPPAYPVETPSSAEWIEWVRAQFADRTRELPAELAIPLATLLGPAPLLEVLLEGLFATAANTHSWYLRHDLPLFRGFWEYVLPFLNTADLDPLREQLRPKLDPATWPKSGYDSTPRPYFLAALLGLSEQIEDVVRTWPVVGPKDPKPWQILSHQPLLVLFGLRNPARIEAVARNLGCTFSTPFDLRGWLANTGASGLDFAAKLVQERDASWQGRMSEEFCRIPDPAAAPHVLALKVNGAFPATARQWLARNVGSAVAGLLDTATGRGKVAEAAGEYFRDLSKTGFGWVIERELPNVAPEVAARVRKAVIGKPERATETIAPGTEPEWLTTAYSAVASSRAKLPDWLAPATLPPLLFDGRRLSDEHVAALLREVKANPDDAGIPQFAHAVKQRADAGTADRFVTALFERWVAEKDGGADGADGWVFSAVAWLGGDAAVATVVPKLKRWPGGTSAKRLKEGMKAIRRIGTPYALAQLANMAGGGGNHRLRSYATHEVTETAKKDNITLEQLEDRIIPTLGLDDASSTEATLDFGPRQFRAFVAPDLQLLARDDRGKGFLVLPTPRKTDDPVKVNEARVAWRLAKKQFDLVMGGVCKRMEKALIDQRRWGAAEFDQYIAGHPISGAVVRRLLWGRFEVSGALLASFRVSEEGEYVDADDRPLPPLPADTDATIRLLHPVHLGAAERATWAERLADYEIVPPFPQLARPVIDLTDEEKAATELTRFNRKDLQRYTVQAMPSFGKWQWEHQSVARHFLRLGVKAVAKMSGWNPMELSGVLFRSNATVPRNGEPHPPLVLGSVDPVMLSECLADVRAWVGG